MTVDQAFTTVVLHRSAVHSILTWTTTSIAMLLLSKLLLIEAPLRLAVLATVSSILTATPASAQTYTKCNPTQGTCPADTALGSSIDVDFTSGQSSHFSAGGAPTYDSNGASFTVAKTGDAPTLTSNWYIMFGRYDIVMKASPGAGIVSSVVLQSDDLDEIDWEWLGSENDQVQSNYFGKGQTTTYDRSAVLSVPNTQSEIHTYTLIWTSTQIVWQVDGVTQRALSASNANGQFPQTPMQLKIGSWSGGDPSNPAGTISWAEGPTNYADGPFTMVVKSISVQDASTGTSYSYDGTGGTWESIQSNGGTINGGGTGTDAAAPAITSTTSGDVPFDGTHRSSAVTSTPGIGSWQASTTLTTATNTAYPGLPSGWTVNGSGKVVPASVGPVSTHLPLSIHIPFSGALLTIFSRRTLSLLLPRRLQSRHRCCARVLVKRP